MGVWIERAIKEAPTLLLGSLFIDAYLNERYSAPVFVGIVALLAIFYLARLLSRTWQTVFVISILSASGALLAAEVYLSHTVRSPAALREEVARQSGIPFDGRSKFEVVMALRDTGVPAVPLFSASHLRPMEWGRPPAELKTPPGQAPLFPLAGLSKTPTVFCNETGRYITYRSDERGFRNPEGGGPYDLALIGDSYTQGACVGDSENLAGLLGQSGVNALNLGIGGFGPLTELAVLTEYAAPLRPKRVIWGFSANDLQDLREELQTPFLIRYLEDGFQQGLARRQEEIDRMVGSYLEASLQSRQKRPPISGLASLAEYVRLKAVRSFIVDAMTAREVAGRKKPYTAFEKILKKARERVEAWGGTLLFLYFPSYGDVTGVGGSIRKKTLQVVNEVGLTIIDPTEVMRNRPNPKKLFPFGLPGHYNAEGYAVVADLLIAQKNLVSK